MFLLDPTDERKWLFKEGMKRRWMSVIYFDTCDTFKGQKKVDLMSKERARCTNFIVQGRRNRGDGRGALWARIAQNVKKPPLTVNVVDFEFFGFNVSIWVPWSPLGPKKS